MNLISKLIEKHLKDKDVQAFSKPGKNFSLNPSVLGDDCLRKKYFSYFRMPQKAKEIDNILILESGNTVHERVQDWLGDLGIAIDYLDPKTGKVPVNYYTGKKDIEFPISIPQLLIQKGKIDRVCLMDDELWLIEVKSIGSEQYKKLDEPKFDHTIQGTVYLFGFEMCLQAGNYDHIPKLRRDMVPKGLKFIYVNRDTGQMKEYFLERNESLFVRICKDIQELAYYILNKELPPPPKGGMCKFCPYPELCGKNLNPPGENK
jgi:hypothetical protein